MFLDWKQHALMVKKAFGKLGGQHPKMLQAYQALGQAAEAEALDAKTRELIAIAVGVTTRCDGCIAVHTKAAKAAGATREEIAEALGVAVALNAGAAMVYSARALDALGE